MSAESIALSRERPKSYQAIFWGGLIAGILDISAAFVHSALAAGRSPMWVLQYVASGLAPGNYIVQVYGGNAQSTFLRSATLGGRDIATGFTTSGPAAVELVVSTKGGSIEGTVTEKEADVDNDHLVANATVVAVPEGKYRKLPDHFVTGALQFFHESRGAQRCRRFLAASQKGGGAGRRAYQGNLLRLTDDFHRQGSAPFAQLHYLIACYPSQLGPEQTLYTPCDSAFNAEVPAQSLLIPREA